MATKKKATKARSAVSGKYVTKAQAKANPRETVVSRESVGTAILKKRIVEAIAESNSAEGDCRTLLVTTSVRKPLPSRLEILEEVAGRAFSAWQHALRAATLQEALDAMKGK